MREGSWKVDATCYYLRCIASVNLSSIIAYALRRCLLREGTRPRRCQVKKKKKKVAESKNGKATRQCSDRGEVRLRCTRYDVDQVTRWDTLLMTMLYDWHSKDSDMMHDDVWW